MKFAPRKPQSCIDLRGNGPGEGVANRGRLINGGVYRLISTTTNSFFFMAQLLLDWPALTLMALVPCHVRILG